MDKLLEQLPVSPGIATIIGLAAILILTALASAVLKSVVFKLIARLTSKTSSNLDDLLLNATRSNLALLIYVIGISIAFEFIESRYSELVSTELFNVVDNVIYAIGVVIVAILLLRVFSALLQWYAGAVAVKTETTLDDEFLPLLNRSVKIIVVTLALLIILDSFGIDVKGLVAVLGVGSLAVALAAKDTLANVIGGFTIMIDRPFRVGDMVKLPDDRRVTVHEIGIRSTKFKTFDNTLVIVPNAELTISTIHNITYPEPLVRIIIRVGVSYDSDIEKVREILLDEAHKHKDIVDDPKPNFYFYDFGDSSLNVAIRCYVDRAEKYRRTSSDLREQIYKRFKVEGIEIPFPQRVITMAGNESAVENKIE